MFLKAMCIYLYISIKLRSLWNYILFNIIYYIIKTLRSLEYHTLYFILNIYNYQIFLYLLKEAINPIYRKWHNLTNFWFWAIGFTMMYFHSFIYFLCLYPKILLEGVLILLHAYFISGRKYHLVDTLKKSFFDLKFFFKCVKKQSKS